MNLWKKKFFDASDDVKAKAHAEFCNVKLVIENLMAKWDKEKTTKEMRWVETGKSLRSKDVSFNKFLKLIEFAMAIPGKLTKKIAKRQISISLFVRHFHRNECSMRMIVFFD